MLVYSRSKGIVLCPPSSGKTFLVNKHPDKFVDSDVLFSKLLEDQDRLYAVEKDDDIIQEVNKLMKTLNGKTLLTNVSMSYFGFDQHVFMYDSGDYIEHIKLAQREDLISEFGETELIQWMKDFEHPESVIMHKELYISDYILID